MNDKEIQDCANKFINKMDDMRAALGEEKYAEFIKGLTPEILADSDLICDLFEKVLAAGESDDNNTELPK